VLVFSVLSQFSLTLRPGLAAVSSLVSVSTLDPDFIFSGNNVTRIENGTLTVTGTMIVEDNATLYLVNMTIAVDAKGTINVEGNATLYLVNSTLSYSNRAREYNMMTLRNPVNGNPRLILRNSNMVSKFSRAFAIRFYGNSSGDFEMMNTDPKLAGARLDVKAYNSSMVRLSGCTVYSVYAYSDSNVTILSSKFSTLYAEGSPAVSVLASTFNSAVDPVLRAYDYSEVSVAGCTVEGNISAYDHSVLSISNTRIKGGWRLSINDYSRVEIISNSTVSLHKYSTNVDVKGFSFFSVSHAVLQNLRVNTYDNAVASISDTVATYISIFARDFSNVTILRSRLDWFLRALDHSVVSVLNSTLTTLRVEDFSVVYVSSSNLSMMHAEESANTTVSNSIIEELSIVSDSVNGSITGLEPGFFDWWNFTSFIKSSRGYVPLLLLINTQIRGDWDLTFLGSSNVTIANSTINFLEAFDSSVVKVVNSVLGSEYVVDQAVVRVWSYLRVHVVDRFGIPLAWANVSLQSNGSPVESKVTDVNGWVSFTVLERVIDGSGVYPYDSYTVDATWAESSGQQAVKMAGSKEIALTLPLPWWYEYAIIAVCIVIGVGIVLFVLVMKRRAPKPGAK